MITAPQNTINQSLPYRLAEEFSLRTNRCLFITGKAGTGKTTFLKHLIEVSPKNIAVVAPTGVAAINARGMTIHSFFQLPIRTLIPTPESYKQMFAEQRMMHRKRQILYHLEMLVIDEISMVRADVLDAIDAILRHYRYRRNDPFGGVQVVMIGDLMQLQPVVHGDEEKELLARYYDGPYFFQSKVMQQVQPAYIELDHVFRQKNAQFVKVLNEVRENRLSEEGRAMLASRYIPDFEDEYRYAEETKGKDSHDDFHITLTTHNHQADDLNHRKLGELNGRLYTFNAEVKKNFPETSYPTEATLMLKEGARVMFIRNDDQKPRRFYNGKLGIVKTIEEGTILVSCDDGEIEVEPMTWENIRYKEDAQTGKIQEEMLGTFTQYPLRLAWAITIHKSQGLTFDRVKIDAAYAFAAGQIYVALSRCRTLEGIVLSSPLQKVNFSNDRQVLNYVNAQPTTEQTKEQLGLAEREYQLQLFSELYNMKPLLKMVEQMTKHVAKSVSFNTNTLPFLNELKFQISEIWEVADRFREQLTKIILSKNEDRTILHEDFLQQRLNAAAGYFVPKIQELKDKVGEHPCKCKNKEDASDFDTMIKELHLILSQKIILMQTIAKDATIDAYLKTKSCFITPPMKVTSVYNKSESRAKVNKRNTVKIKSYPKSKKKPIPSTYEQTYDLYLAGKTVEQIAKIRDLNYNTILEHLAHYVISGHILITKFVPDNIINEILSVRAGNPNFTTLKEFYDSLGGRVPYPYLSAVLEGYHLI